MPHLACSITLAAAPQMQQYALARDEYESGAFVYHLQACGITAPMLLFADETSKDGRAHRRLYTGRTYALCTSSHPSLCTGSPPSSQALWLLAARAARLRSQRPATQRAADVRTLLVRREWFCCMGLLRRDFRPVSLSAFSGARCGGPHVALCHTCLAMSLTPARSLTRYSLFRSHARLSALEPTEKTP